MYALEIIVALNNPEVRHVATPEEKSKLLTARQVARRIALLGDHRPLESSASDRRKSNA